MRNSLTFTIVKISPTTFGVERFSSTQGPFCTNVFLNFTTCGENQKGLNKNLAMQTFQKSSFIICVVTKCWPLPCEDHEKRRKNYFHMNLSVGWMSQLRTIEHVGSHFIFSFASANSLFFLAPLHFYLFIFYWLNNTFRNIYWQYLQQGWLNRTNII